ncbi:hypothetical protein BH11MYX1_BH11MYX1_25160 [soil metagenome]
MQRRSQRYPVELSVQVFADGKERRVALGDLSRSGAFLKLTPPLAVGEPIAVAMFFEGRQLAVSATVVRTDDAGTGVAFEAPTHHADALFLRAVERLLAKRQAKGTPVEGTPNTERRGSREPEVADRVILRGDLAALGLPAILTMLEQERTSGTLVLRAAGANTAWLELVDGAIASAGSSSTSGHLRAVVMSVLDWAHGEFELVATPPAEAGPGGALPVTWALLEHARICDERRARRHVA